MWQSGDGCAAIQIIHTHTHMNTHTQPVYLKHQHIHSTYTLPHTRDTHAHTHCSSMWLRWCGLLINAASLELLADYTRYSGQHISSSLTLSRSWWMLLILILIMIPSASPADIDTDHDTKCLSCFPAFAVCHDLPISYSVALHCLSVLCLVRMYPHTYGSRTPPTLHSSSTSTAAAAPK